jgi:hypothetical protein
MLEGNERPTAGRYANTDVIDPARQEYLVLFPVALAAGVTVAGLGALILTGFLGYAEEGFPSDLFLQPWPLYLWFCALALLLEVTVLRQPAWRRQLVGTMLWSLLAMALVGIIYFSSPRLVVALSLLGRQAEHAVLTLGQQAITYTVVNAGILLLYWGDRVLSWTSRRPGLTSARVLRRRYLIALDLGTGALLCALLALALQPALLTVLARLLKVNVSVSACMVAVPGTCAPTLSQLDWLAAGVSLAAGLLLLVTSLILGGIMRPRGGARAAGAREPLTLERIIALVGSDRGRLREGLLRLLGGLVGQLRSIFVPLLLLAGSISLASSARAIQVHLHANDALVGPDPGSTLHGITLNAVTNALPGLVEGPVGFSFFAAALGLLLLSWHVVENTRQFISEINTKVVRPTVRIVFLALFGLNWLGLQLHLTRHHPFDAFSLTQRHLVIRRHPRTPQPDRAAACPRPVHRGPPQTPRSLTTWHGA